MPFGSLMTDNIEIIKQDGTATPKVKASVQSKGIYIMNSGKLLIESGDLVRRKMSNGGEETFEVLDPGFHESVAGIEAHYQMKVKKMGIPEAKAAVQNITYNITGSNARINQNSVDNSSNVVTIDASITNQVAQLRSEIEKLSLSQEDKDAAFEVIKTVEHQLASGNAKKSVLIALLGALPHVASITSIINSILGMYK